jgi:hypothetical protein
MQLYLQMFMTEDDVDGDGKMSFEEFKPGLFNHC